MKGTCLEGGNKKNAESGNKKSGGSKDGVRGPKTHGKSQSTLSKTRVGLLWGTERVKDGNGRKTQKINMRQRSKACHGLVKRAMSSNESGRGWGTGV